MFFVCEFLGIREWRVAEMLCFLCVRILWRGLTLVCSVPVLVPRGMPCDKGGADEAFKTHLELASSPKKVMTVLQQQRRLGWLAINCLLIDKAAEEEGQQLPLQTSAQTEQRVGVGVVHSLVDRVPDVHCLPSAAPLPQARGRKN